MTTPTPQGAPDLENRAFDVTSAWLRQSKTSATGAQLAAMCDFAKFILESRAAIQQAALAAPAEVLTAAKAANKHWNEFGPAFGFDEFMDALDRALAVAPPPDDAVEQQVKPSIHAGSEANICYLSNTIPPAVGRQPLTKEQIRDAITGVGLCFTAPDMQVARAIEAAHGITASPESVKGTEGGV